MNKKTSGAVRGDISSEDLSGACSQAELGEKIIKQFAFLTGDLRVSITDGTVRIEHRQPATEKMSEAQRLSDQASQKPKSGDFQQALHFLHTSRRHESCTASGASCCAMPVRETPAAIPYSRGLSNSSPPSKRKSVNAVDPRIPNSSRKNTRCRVASPRCPQAIRLPRSTACHGDHLRGRPAW